MVKGYHECEKFIILRPSSKGSYRLNYVCDASYRHQYSK